MQIIRIDSRRSNFRMTVSLDGRQFVFRFRWNSRSRAWFLGIDSITGTVLLEGVKIVPDYEILRQYKNQSLPPGALMILKRDNRLERISRTDLVGKNAVMGYLTENEIGAVR